MQKKEGVVLIGTNCGGSKSVTLGKDGQVRIWDTRSGVLLKPLGASYNKIDEKIRFLDFSLNRDI